MTPDQDLSALLLPCPFCGGEAKMQRTSTRYYWVQCQNRECAAEGRAIDYEAPAVDAWNRRVPADHERAVKAAVAKAVEAEAALWMQAIAEYSSDGMAYSIGQKAAAIRSRGVAG